MFSIFRKLPNFKPKVKINKQLLKIIKQIYLSNKIIKTDLLSLMNN